jgi:hypothetical protein
MIEAVLKLGPQEHRKWPCSTGHITGTAALTQTRTVTEGTP